MCVWVIRIQHQIRLQTANSIQCSMHKNPEQYHNKLTNTKMQVKKITHDRVSRLHCSGELVIHRSKIQYCIVLYS